MNGRPWVLIAFGCVAILAGAATTVLLLPARAAGPGMVSARPALPVEAPRLAAEFCRGLTAELREAAAVPVRLGQESEAQRQGCSTTAAAGQPGQR